MKYLCLRCVLFGYVLHIRDKREEPQMDHLDHQQIRLWSFHKF